MDWLPFETWKAALAGEVASAVLPRDGLDPDGPELSTQQAPEGV